MENILSRKYTYPGLVKRIQQKESFILATVVDCHGSSPQKPGSSAVFNAKELLEGTIGGGLVENTIQEKAADAVKSKVSEYLRFELNDDIEDDNSAICGGGMCILLDAAPEKHMAVFKELAESYQNRTPGVLLTTANDYIGKELLIERCWITENNFAGLSVRFDKELNKTIKQALERTSMGLDSGVLCHTPSEIEGKYVFLECIVPLPQLIIAGAGHIGRALAHFGKLLDFEVTVWDDREEYANKTNIPDADQVLSGELSKTLGKLVTGPESFIVIVTRGHKEDAEVLKRFIDSRAAYIGMIGSKKKVAKVKEKFINEGYATTKQWDRIHAPIGLDIGSKTVQEIAISIVAQLVQVRQNLNRRK